VLGDVLNGVPHGREVRPEDGCAPLEKRSTVYLHSDLLYPRPVGVTDTSQDLGRVSKLGAASVSIHEQKAMRR
jgi:hypothetical protein